MHRPHAENGKQRCFDQAGKGFKIRIVRCLGHRQVKSQIGLREAAGIRRGRLHGLQYLAQVRKIGLGAIEGCQPCCIWLYRAANMRQLVQKIHVNAHADPPGKNILIKPVPPRSGRDKCADFLFRVDEALGLQRLHHLTRDDAGDAEAFLHLCFGRKPVSRLALPRQDFNAQQLDDRGVSEFPLACQRVGAMRKSGHGKPELGSDNMGYSGRFAPKLGPGRPGENQANI